MIYHRNSKVFFSGQTDLENPRPLHGGTGVYFTGTSAPFRIFHDMEYRHLSYGSMTIKVLPAGIYRIPREAYPGAPTVLERLGDDYTIEQGKERDRYWEAYKAFHRIVQGIR